MVYAVFADLIIKDHFYDSHITKHEKELQNISILSHKDPNTHSEYTQNIAVNIGTQVENYGIF